MHVDVDLIFVVSSRSVHVAVARHAYIHAAIFLGVSSAPRGKYQSAHGQGQHLSGLMVMERKVLSISNLCFTADEERSVAHWFGT